MTIEQIKEQLCYYDKRNPNYIESDRILSKDTYCSCDNCFYGRHSLAEELLRVKALLNSAVEPIR